MTKYWLIQVFPLILAEIALIVVILFVVLLMGIPTFLLCEKFLPIGDKSISLACCSYLSFSSCFKLAAVKLDGYFVNNRDLLWGLINKLEKVAPKLFFNFLLSSWSLSRSYFFSSSYIRLSSGTLAGLAFPLLSLISILTPNSIFPVGLETMPYSSVPPFLVSFSCLRYLLSTLSGTRSGD